MNDKTIKDTDAQPPQAPDIKRQLRLYGFQWVGIPLLLLLPILAILGVFGESFDTLTAREDPIQLQLDYSTRYRYKMINPLQVMLENTGDSTLETVTVHFERAYVDRFSTVTFKPSIKQATVQSYDVELTDIAAGETRVITVELQGEQYGNHEGTVTVDVNGSELLSLDVVTFIFP